MKHIIYKITNKINDRIYIGAHSTDDINDSYMGSGKAIKAAQRKYGIEIGKNYNLPKSEDSRQPQCPPEKERAIREALKYFGMI